MNTMNPLTVIALAVAVIVLGYLFMRFLDSRDRHNPTDMQAV